MPQDFFHKLVDAADKKQDSLSYEPQIHVIDGKEVAVQRVLPGEKFIAMVEEEDEDTNEGLPGFVDMINSGQSDLAQNAKNIVRNQSV